MRQWKKVQKCCIYQKNPTVTPDVLAAKPLNKADEWISVGYYYLDQDSPDKTIVWWFNGWQECENIFPTVLRDPSSSECDQLVPSSGFFSNWLQDYQSLIEDNPQRNLLMVKNGLNFCQGVVARFPDMNCLLKNNFIESTAHLLLALGKSKQAIILLEQLIDQQPHTAHGYAVLAAVLSLDAQRYNLSPDIERAKKLLLQARQNTTDYEGWDVEFRLEDLQEWQPG
jgi:tetratricopeptide (TPR) repeat protein